MIQPWQLNVLNKMQGVRRGEMFTMTSGRQIGKSHFTAQNIQRLMESFNSQPINDLVLSEGTVYGARYYCVEPVGGNWLDIETWCNDIFGSGHHSIWSEPKAPEPAQRWYANNRKFWFRDEKDRMMFILKWR